MGGRIIIADHGDLLFFPDLRSAERYLEPVDVRARAYEGFLEDGRRLELKVVPESRNGLLGSNYKVEQTRLEPQSAGDIERLQALLVDFLSRVPQPPDRLDAMSLPELLDEAEHWALTE